MERPEIVPSVGFCIQTESLGTPAGRWYLNICRHKLVEMPIAHSGKVITREFILGHGIGSCKIPFDMGSFRKLKARAEGAKQTAYCIDAIFNPFIVQMFTDDSFNETMKEYRPFIINLVLQRVESSIGVKLSTHKVKLVKNFLYKDGEGPNCNEPREFMDLPDEIESVEEVQPQRKPPVVEKEADPLIQDVTPGKKKPALKKGFFNNAKESLYPPEGSKEGVVPENAGDPLGYLPKKLRKSCQVVDCNSPGYQETERKKQAAEEANSRNKEFNDMISSSCSSVTKAGSQWDTDLPDGAEPPPNQKYEVDYSRFEKVVEEDEVSKPLAEDRNWYLDQNGKQCSHSGAKPSMVSQPSGAEAEPAMKKGFLDNAKTPLYPKGSEQRAPPNEADMLKNFGGNDADLLKNFGGSEEEMMKQFSEVLKLDRSLPESGAPQALKPTVTAKVPERKAPQFKLDRDDNEGLFQLIVDVPGLDSMKGVDLDVTESSASLAFPSSVGLNPLKVELPAEVIPSGVKAKFSKKTNQLTIKLPLLLQVAKAG